MSSSDRIRQIDQLINTLDQHEATSRETLKKTRSRTMQEAKQKIALAEMESVGANASTLSTALRGGQIRASLSGCKCHSVYPPIIE
jgi:hypothetical protein